MVSNFRLSIPSLTSLIQALERFQDFETKNRATALGLYSRQLALRCGWSQETAEIHCHRIAALIINEEGA